jgi:hypothetical protein
VDEQRPTPKRFTSQRSVSGWRKKQALVLARAPVLTDECPRDVGNRRVWCRRYEKCLNYAMAHDWYGFTCDACAVEDQFTPAEILERSRGALGGHPDGLFDALGPDEESGSVSEKEELTLEEAAALVGMGKNWLVRLGNKGELKMRKEDGKPLFARVSLMEFKARREAKEVKGGIATVKIRVREPSAEATALARVKLIVQCVAADLMARDEAFGRIEKLVTE